jgi:preprotein translocase subunit SecA
MGYESPHMLQSLDTYCEHLGALDHLRQASTCVVKKSPGRIQAEAFELFSNMLESVKGEDADLDERADSQRTGYRAAEAALPLNVQYHHADYEEARTK